MILSPRHKSGKVLEHFENRLKTRLSINPSDREFGTRKATLRVVLMHCGSLMIPFFGNLMANLETPMSMLIHVPEVRTSHGLQFDCFAHLLPYLENQ